MVVEYDGVEMTITKDQVVYPPGMTKLTVAPAMSGGGSGGGRTAGPGDGRGYSGGGGGRKPTDPPHIVFFDDK